MTSFILKMTYNFVLPYFFSNIFGSQCGLKFVVLLIRLTANFTRLVNRRLINYFCLQALYFPRTIFCATLCSFFLKQHFLDQFLTVGANNIVCISANNLQ